MILRIPLNEENFFLSEEILAALLYGVSLVRSFVRREGCFEICGGYVKSRSNRFHMLIYEVPIHDGKFGVWCVTSESMIIAPLPPFLGP